MKKIFYFTLILLLLFAFSSISMAQEQVIRVALTYDSKTFDPANAQSVSSAQVMNNIFSRLIDYKFGTAELEGDLSKEWSVTDDGMVYTFVLKEGVQFHKGYGEMTAEDVKYTFDRLLSPDLVASEKSFYKDIDHVETEGDYTVKIYMKNSNTSFPHILARASSSILSKKASEEFEGEIAQNPIGTGPFEFVKWTPQQETVVKAFDDYHKGRAQLDRVIFIPIPDPSTLSSAFRSGNVDIIQVTDPNWYQQFKEDAKYKISQTPALNTRFIGFNVDIEPFDDIRVRKAMQYGFNKKSLLENVLPGISTPANGPFAPDTFGYEPDVTKYDYNPEKAKELLAEAGYPDGFQTTLYVPNIDRFTIPAQVYQSDMKKIGIDLNIQIMETSTFLDKAGRGETPVFSLSRGHTPLPIRLAYSWFHPDNKNKGGNYGQYDNPEMTNLIDELRDSLKMDKIDSLLGEIQKLAADEAVYLYIDYEDNIYAMQSHVNGFKSDPFRSLRMYETSLSN